MTPSRKKVGKITDKRRLDWLIDKSVTVNYLKRIGYWIQLPGRLPQEAEYKTGRQAIDAAIRAGEGK